MSATVVEVVVGLLAGVVAGAAFFGGLAMTVRQLPDIRSPGLLMVTSLVVRLVAVAVLLVVVARWLGSSGLAGAAVGIVGVRVALVRAARVPRSGRPGGSGRPEGAAPPTAPTNPTADRPPAGGERWT